MKKLGRIKVSPSPFIVDWYVFICACLFLFTIIASCIKSVQELPDTLHAVADDSDLTPKANAIDKNSRINIVCNTAITNSMLNDLKAFRNVAAVFPEINALTMVSPTYNLDKIKRLHYVSSAGADG